MPTSASYTLEQAAAAAAAAAAAESEAGTPPFLRRGLVLPFRRDQKNDFANDAGAAVIRSNVRQILGTKGPGDGGEPGELPWFTEFGSRAHALRHRPLSEVIDELAYVHVIDALRKWEPRARVTDVWTEKLARTLRLHLRFDILDPSSPGVALVTGVEETIDYQLAA